ncbi:MAG TPA: VOC family protein, partial [Thermomicrobiales bacterium]|nr:VOC family protein [Thermomicrobiales bacterium]
MPTQIDHVVVVARHLDRAIAGAERAGFTVVPGGEHAGGQSHNALIAFRDGTYIELFAFIDPDQQSAQALWTRLWQGSGLADVATPDDDPLPRLLVVRLDRQVMADDLELLLQIHV